MTRLKTPTRSTYQLAPFADVPLDEDLLEHLIDRHECETLPRLGRMWRYFRNELAAPSAAGGSDGPPQQRSGLPVRLRNDREALGDDRFRREIVIENDIAWRIHTLVDFMFPASPRILSAAPDSDRRRAIEAILEAVINAHGGIRLWQDIALLGSVYGHVDLLVNADALFARWERGDGVGPAANRGAQGSASRREAVLEAPSRREGELALPSRREGVREMPSHPGGAHPDRAGNAAQDTLSDAEVQSLGELIHIEAVEAPRAIPLLNPSDYKSLDAYIIHFQRPVHAMESRGVLSRVLARAFLPQRRLAPADRAFTTVTHIYSDRHVQRYEDEHLVFESRNRLGRIPVVHIQNLSQPYFYDGLSDVEPLIPLQDELNTRLSDRANRVTMQSFRMWLGKGIDGFTDRPIGPGQMWMTDNENASIEGFGGDADSPSEKAHIEELREALDKTSGVTPAAAGHIKAKIGNLTSENALRISLMGTIAKVKRKRITYGRGIAELCELILHALDASGAFRTRPAERDIEIVWPDPLPADESRRIDDAIKKSQLGIPLEMLRAELGYGE